MYEKSGIQKTNSSNFILTKSPLRKRIFPFEEKETVKAMSKGVYI